MYGRREIAVSDLHDADPTHARITFSTAFNEEEDKVKENFILPEESVPIDFTDSINKVHSLLDKTDKIIKAEIYADESKKLTENNEQYLKLEEKFFNLEKKHKTLEVITYTVGGLVAIDFICNIIGFFIK